MLEELALGQRELLPLEMDGCGVPVSRAEATQPWYEAVEKWPALESWQAYAGNQELLLAAQQLTSDDAAWLLAFIPLFPLIFRVNGIP